MTFASDAQRRWFFANLASAGGSSESAGGGSSGGESAVFTSSVVTNALPIDVDAGQARRDARISYAQSMYPHLSEPDALRQLNDREGLAGLPK